ncbi:IS701 family transposase [Thiorhodococcus minor]|uniref:Transposase n=1 Tax=Thiorhodococcus minor TaxID=57489 RepID=A0A6M0K6G2_9GAMM|nr:transposase [Thiorhodococcus minor]NEV65366.1 transposase [Thiorhodococcus minor]
MSMLRAIGGELQCLFPMNPHGQERFEWFVLTLKAILVPITVSRTSNLRRAIATLFGVSIAEWRYDTFMASVKLPWEAVWETLWRAIPQPLVEGRLLLALDDSINPKTGRHIFACQTTFDHAAKANQTRWPWAQTLVTLGLLMPIHGRWCCLPMAFRFYLRRATLQAGCLRVRGKAVVFADKFAQAVSMIVSLARCFQTARVLVITDSWFGNNGLFRPLRQPLGTRVDLLSRLRVNAVLYAQPEAVPGKLGRPRKYGARLGSVAECAKQQRAKARCYQVRVYGATREVEAADQVVMLKTLRCAVRVVWVYRRSQWVALMTTDLRLSVAQIVEYYSARWKIEAGFRELKQEIGSAATQTRHPDAVTNHLHFCMVATTLTWIYAAHLKQAPARRYASQSTTEYAFADVRRALAKDIAEEGFGSDCPKSGKAQRKSFISEVMRLVA